MLTRTVGAGAIAAPEPLMETSVVLAVLVGALLHAGWNTLVKSSGDKELDIALVHFLGALVSLPLLWAVGMPPREAWPFIGASLIIHCLLYTSDAADE